MTDLTQLTAARLSRLYRKGKASPVETMRRCWRGPKRSIRINAFCRVDAGPRDSRPRASERRWKKGKPLSR
jgi:aspartyl-tRNA(Asn)/glutamyl-tRNA(Gln) amidotransferase subunit A